MTETIDTGVTTRPESPLGMPTQAVPIDRTPAGVALAASAGVEAAGWWDVVKTVGSGLVPIGDALFS